MGDTGGEAPLLASYRPEGPDGDPSGALLVLLHGRGADERDLAPLAAALAPTLPCVLLRAPLPWGPGWQWYAMAADGRPDPDTWRDGQQALAAALTRLRGERPTAPVVLGGFSQGAAMAAAWTLTTDRPPHALLVFSGYLPDLGAGRAVSGLPVFVGHGLQDPVLPVAHGRQLADAFAARGAVVTARYYTVGHGLHPEEVEDARRFLTECLQPTS